jgi:hypothetical protein
VSREGWTDGRFFLLVCRHGFLILPRNERGARPREFPVNTEDPGAPEQKLWPQSYRRITAPCRLSDEAGLDGRGGSFLRGGGIHGDPRIAGNPAAQRILE